MNSINGAEGRNEIERLFRRLKRFRRTFSRFEKLDVILLGFISFHFIVDGLLQIDALLRCEHDQMCRASPALVVQGTHQVSDRWFTIMGHADIGEDPDIA